MVQRFIAGCFATTIVAAFLFVASPAQAQVGEWAFKRLNTAHEAMGESKYKDAEDALNRMKDRLGRLNDNEAALMWQTFGHLYFTQSKYKPAAEAFEKSLATGALNPAQIADMRFNLGQLYMAMERWKDAVKTFELWLPSVQNPSPDARFILGQAYIQTKAWPKALAQVSVAVSAKRKPPEAWLQTLGSCQFQLKKNRDLARTLTRLIELYPKASYWLQLGGVYGELDDEKRSLAVYQLAYAGGFLSDPNHIKNLAQMLVYQNVPLRGAQILEKEMDTTKRIEVNVDNLKILADAWVRAKELDTAVKPLARAAKLGKSGELYLRLAQLHLESERWDAAVKAAGDAVSTGKLKDSGQAYLIRGIAAFYGGKRGAAMKALQRASRSKNATTANVARQWLALISSVA
ncbi:MAG: tetratricopeptide repeat protein [Myxococcota bacterium]